MSKTSLDTSCVVQLPFWPHAQFKITVEPNSRAPPQNVLYNRSFILRGLAYIYTAKWKALKCKPSANCTCAVPLIHGLGYYLCLLVVSPTSSSRRVWHVIATVVDSMRESIHALCCDLCLQDIHRASRPCWGKPVLISILACRLCFDAITLERSTFTKIAMNKVYSAEPVGFTFWPVCCAWWQKTWLQTHTHTETQTKYCNPRCACVPTVNNP